MESEYDWWEVPSAIGTKQIQILKETILKNYESVEEENNGARDREGNLLKNIKPKNIRLKNMPALYDEILDMAFHISYYKFGVVSFPKNVWDNLLYNVYSGDIKARYGEHHDSSRSWAFDAKLTFLLNLSPDEYEGGDLIINKRLTNFRKPGSVILFKSNLMHEVTPVTKGERITLTYFINGPKFQ